MSACLFSTAEQDYLYSSVYHLSVTSATLENHLLKIFKFRFSEYLGVPLVNLFQTLDFSSEMLTLWALQPGGVSRFYGGHPCGADKLFILPSTSVFVNLGRRMLALEGCPKMRVTWTHLRPCWFD